MKTRVLAPAPRARRRVRPRFDPRLADAPLVGRTWVSAEQRSTRSSGRSGTRAAPGSSTRGRSRLRWPSADFVALGEVHDNPDHHLLQARLAPAPSSPPAGVRRSRSRCSRADQQPAMDAALQARRATRTRSRRRWSGRTAAGRTSSYYRPIFAAGLAAGLPIVAANLPRAQAKEIMAKGRDGLDDGLQAAARARGADPRRRARRRCARR